jgi:hypothetical protein
MDITAVPFRECHRTPICRRDTLIMRLAEMAVNGRRADGVDASRAVQGAVRSLAAS